MLFNKKKREEKKQIKQLEEEESQKSLEIVKNISLIEEESRERQKTLDRDIEIDEENLSFYQRMKKGLKKTQQAFFGSLDQISNEEEIDEEFLEDLEEKLLAADIGLLTTTKVIEILEDKIEKREIRTGSEAIKSLKNIFISILDRKTSNLPTAASGPTVYLFVGVNGVGKTTSIGKLASKFHREGKKVLLAAGDTFRAAAIEQLAEWAKRSGVDFVAREIDSDPSAVMYEAAQKAVRENYDVLLCDTSGRLHTKKNLMDELKKNQKVISKVIPDAPHASLLVLDANTGQNAIVQTREFKELIGLDGLIITKLDGTAKGGVVIGIVNEFEIPVYYIGIGERISDLQPFFPAGFADSLFD